MEMLIPVVKMSVEITESLAVYVEGNPKCCGFTEGVGRFLRDLMDADLRF